MVAATLSPARVLRRPRRADPRAFIGLFLTVAALAGSISFWVSSSEARPVLVAVRDLPVGATLRSSDLTVAYVRMDDNLYHAAVSAEMLGGLVGRQLSEPVHAQQILARGQVTDRIGLGPDQVAITIPAHPDTAVDGRLRPGDAVQILVTTVDKARAEARTRLVLERVQVYSIGREQSLSSTSSVDQDGFSRAPISSVTLAVSADQARTLAEARRLGELDVVLLPATSTAPSQVNQEAPRESS
jgi:Flp pilus assembly protein CpaB